MQPCHETKKFTLLNFLPPPFHYVLIFISHIYIFKDYIFHIVKDLHLVLQTTFFILVF